MLETVRMKRWVLVGACACFAAACQGQVVHLGPSDDGGQEEGGNATNGDGGASSGASATTGGGASSGASGSTGGGGSSGPAQVVPDGAVLDEVTPSVKQKR